MSQSTSNTVNDFKTLPKTAREFTCFLDFIIEEAFKNLPVDSVQTYIRCHKKKCFGNISTQIDFDEDLILWKCSNCNTSGTIKGCFELAWANTQKNEFKANEEDSKI